MPRAVRSASQANAARAAPTDRGCLSITTRKFWRFLISAPTGYSSPSSKKHPRIELEPARALRTGVQIDGRGGDVAVSERFLHFGQGGAAVDGVAGVCVPKPMGTHGRFDASLGRR